MKINGENGLIGNRDIILTVGPLERGNVGRSFERHKISVFCIHRSRVAVAAMFSTYHIKCILTFINSKNKKSIKVKTHIFCSHAQTNGRDRDQRPKQTNVSERTGTCANERDVAGTCKRTWREHANERDKINVNIFEHVTSLFYFRFYQTKKKSKK